MNSESMDVEERIFIEHVTLLDRECLLMKGCES